MTSLQSKNNVRRLSDYVHPPESNIILIASGKGGVGKTWFTITLAHILARQGQRVLIFDGDLGLANIDIQLGLMPAQDLGSVLEGEVSFPEAIFSYKPGNFDILPGRSGSGDLSQLAYPQLIRIQEELRELAKTYDHIFIDLGAGLGGTVRSLTPVAAQCFLVINDEPTSMTDGYAFLKVTRKSNPGIDFRIVVNQADNASSGHTTFAAFSQVSEKFLGYRPELAGIIRRDTHVKDAIRSQSSLVTRFPNCSSVLDVTRIATTF